MLDQLLDRPNVPADAKPMSREFISSVFLYMFGALALTGITSWLFASSGSVQILYNANGTGMSGLGYLIMFAPLGIVIAMQMAVHRLSMVVLSLMFIAYSVLLGLSLSSIFLVYQLGTIGIAFGATSLTFGAMAVLGYTTKTDLTKFGTYLYMAFIGIFIAGLLNWIFQSSMMNYVISMIGVVVFTGLTAVEMQRIKWMSYDTTLEGAARSKMALLGGLRLYILFINLFVSLLNIMGSRD